MRDETSCEACGWTDPDFEHYGHNCGTTIGSALATWPEESNRGWEYVA